jgi:hypothetical protein
LSPRLYAVPDGLTCLRDRLPMMAGAVLDRISLGLLIEEVEELRDQALRQAFELSRLRWNESVRIIERACSAKASAFAEASADRSQDEEAEAVIEAVHRKGSNIVLFPPMDRSNPFSPSGAA